MLRHWSACSSGIQAAKAQAKQLFDLMAGGLVSVEGLLQQMFYRGRRPVSANSRAHAR